MAYTTPPTFVAGNVLAAADLNILGDDIEYLKGVSDGTVFSGVLVTRAASTSIPDATSTPITWSAETYDYGSWWASGTDIIVPAGAIPAGFTTIAIDINIRLFFAANATGYRVGSILVNGSSIAGPTSAPVSGVPTEISYSRPTIVAAGDVITVELYQNSGGALNASSMSATVTRVAPVA